MKRNHEPKKIQDLVNQFIEQNELTSGLDAVNVQDLWSDLMGPGVMSYTQSIALRGSTLTVVLTSSVLRSELSMGKQKIISMMNEGLGKNLIEHMYLR
jgi:predicted nucleic acid-binding Zn ribbon protein